MVDKFIPISFLTQAQIRQARVRSAQSRGTHTDDEWQCVLNAAKGRCARCQKEGPLEKDHAIPVSRDDSTEELWNMQPLCIECNRSKGDSSCMNWRIDRKIREKLSYSELQWFTWVKKQAFPEIYGELVSNEGSPMTKDQTKQRLPSLVIITAVNQATAIHNQEFNEEVGPFLKSEVLKLAEFLEEHSPAPEISWHEFLGVPESPDILMRKKFPEWLTMSTEDRMSFLLQMKSSLDSVESGSPSSI